MGVLSESDVRSGLLGSPDFYPQKLDFVRQALLILRVDRGIYRQASFLDDRILTPQTEGRWVSFAEAATWLGDPGSGLPVHFIFHAGHVGSTLVSRMIEEAGGVLGLREPLPLLSLTEAEDERDAGHALIAPAPLSALTRLMVRLWCRGYADTKSVVVKATSRAGRFAAPLLREAPDSKALFVTLAAEPYVAKLLSGENSFLDLRTFAPERYRRLVIQGAEPSKPLHAMNLGEIAAMTWAVERLAQSRAQAAHGARVMALDFDAFLAAPGSELRRVLEHFGIDADERLFVEAAQNPLLSRYSKSLEHAYSPQLRQEILALSRARHGGEIKTGLALLEAMAARSSALAGALSA